MAREDTPHLHQLNLTVDGHETYRWLRAHGYDMVDAGAPFSGGEPGILYARPNQPVHLALNHRVLVWNPIADAVQVLHDVHALDPDVDPRDTEAWLRRTGYAIGPTTDGRDIVFHRDGWPTITARLHDALVWDGHTLTVEGALG